MNIKKRIELFKFINGELKKPYIRGRNDCLTSALKTLDILNDTKIYDEFYGKYYNKKSSFILLKKYGWIGGLFDHLKLIEIKKHLIKIGDIVKSSKQHEPLCLGVFVDEYRNSPGIFTVDIKFGSCITYLPEKYTVWQSQKIN